MDARGVIMDANDKLREIRRDLRIHGTVLGSIVLFFWALELVDALLFHGWMDNWGIWPRTSQGLKGILFAPFLHVGFGHLIANTVPFLVLGWLVMLRRLSDFVTVSLVSLFVSGLGVWLIGPTHSVHLGASGVIFGYFGFLLLRGYFERSFKSLVWSFLVLFFYGGMALGVLPQGQGISWQAHLFGFIGGGLSAYMIANQRKKEPAVRILGPMDLPDGD